MSRPAAVFLALVLTWLGASGEAAALTPGVPLLIDGFESGDDSAWATLVAFRMTDLDLRDPHIFALAGALGCIDFTNFSNFGIEGINPSLQLRIQNDSEPDGLLDLSVANTFRPLNQSAGTFSAGDLVYPDCSAPMASAVCTLPVGAPHAAASANNLGELEICLNAIAGTTSGYSPPVMDTVGPVGGTCFAANPGSLIVPLIFPVALVDAWFAGEWFESPATEIRNGLIRGFLSEAVANATIIPEGTTGVDAIDGSPLSSLLRGGAGSCSQPFPAQGDRDVDGAIQGWYFYLNFSATRVPYTEP